MFTRFVRRVARPATTFRNNSFVQPFVVNTSFAQRMSYSSHKGDDTPKNIAVVLSGCGFMDGSEVTEVVSTMIALSNLGWKIQYFALNGDLEEVWDHSRKTIDKNEVRDIQAECARITRDKLNSLEQLGPDGFDGIVFPGGFGVGKVLSNYARENKSDDEPFTVNPHVERVIKGFYKTKKPMAFMCISPILVAKVLGTKAGGPGVKLSSGFDPIVSEFIKELGNTTQDVENTAVVVDEENRIVSTPAYMGRNPSPAEIYQGISEMVSEFRALFSGRKSGDSEEMNFGHVETVLKHTLGEKKWQETKEEMLKRR